MEMSTCVVIFLCQTPSHGQRRESVCLPEGWILDYVGVSGCDQKQTGLRCDRASVNLVQEALEATYSRAYPGLWWFGVLPTDCN